jgi:hypothetical protein
MTDEPFFRIQTRITRQCWLAKKAATLVGRDLGIAVQLMYDVYDRLGVLSVLSELQNHLYTVMCACIIVP